MKLSFLVRVALATTLLSQIAYAQDPTPTPSPSPTPAAETAAPAATPEPDIWNRETATGDWSGTRSRWKEKGVELEFSLTQFYQGVARGGVKTGSEYNGKFESLFKFDLGKLFGWKYWSAEIQTQTRFGGPLPGKPGGINPVNTAILVPGVDGTVFSITSLNFTRIIPKDLKKGELFVIGFGRYNLLDLIDEDFFAGKGTQRFMNIAPIGPLTVVPAVPLITNGASFAYVKGGEPRFTFALVDPNDHSVDVGLSNLFADGVTLYPGVHFPTKYGGLSGKHSIALAITTKEFTPFDALRQIILPGPPTVPIEPKGGSWSLSYTFRQYLVERAPRDGWGFFTQLSVAGEDTSPITNFVNLGLGGNGLFKNRRRDEFGIEYTYTGLSDVLKDNLDPLDLRRLRAEHQGEIFYNFFITPWLRLTGDLQVIRGVRPIGRTAVVPGARLEIIF